MMGLRDLETALINKLQKFLLELGKGYLLETRQKCFGHGIGASLANGMREQRILSVI